MTKKLPLLSMVFILLYTVIFQSAIKAQTCTGTGTITVQRWNNITGTTVASLTSNANYPNNPSSTSTITLFEIASNTGDNYGIRVSGYICPPTTGSYRFWIAGDDNCQLSLSTNDQPSTKRRIAYHNTFTNPRQWNKVNSQRSGSISLVAGQRYYVEALMKEGTQGDHMAVGWSRPGQSTTAPSEVIPGTRLIPFSFADTQAPTVPAGLAASNITTSSLSLSWNASTDNVAVTGFDVFNGTTQMNSTPVTATTYNVAGLAAGTSYSFRVRARDAANNLSAQSSALVVSTLSVPDTESPTAPSNLVASAISQTSITLNWTAATDNVSVAGYEVYNGAAKLNGALVAGTRYVITGLTAGTTYNLAVQAKDGAGNLSPLSTSIDVAALQTATTPTEQFAMRTVIPLQSSPWDMAWGPDDNIWYTEKTAGRVSFVNPQTGAKTTVLSLGANFVSIAGQDGLLGIALHPEFITGKPWVYIVYTYQSLSATVRRTRVQRYDYNSTTQVLENPVTVIQDIPGSNDHNSGRLAIGPDQKLYYTIGDMGAGQFDNASRTNNAQNLSVLEGKILRLNLEPIAGSWIPADNPFLDGSNNPTPVYSYGHRNAQGLVWGNVNGMYKLYSSEHGPFSDDEINLIEVGRNYGWPQVIGFCDNNYNGRTTGGFTIVNEQTNCNTLNAVEPMRSIYPVATPPDLSTNNMTWPSTAPSGIDFYGSTAIPGWQNSLLMTNLKTGVIARYQLSNNGQYLISDSLNYFRGQGRYRDVIVSPDGLKIYIACDSSGSTSGPTGGVVNLPPNPGSILEFTYQPQAMIVQAGQATITKQVASLVKADKTIDVYPNPARDVLVVYNYSADTKRRATITDMNGRTLQQQPLTGMATRMPTQSLSNGMYLLRVTDNSGKTIATQKVMIQH